jgi:hypothetical protein
VKPSNFRLHIGGLTHGGNGLDDDHLRWTPDVSLKLGDRIEVQFIETDHPDSPVEVRPRDVARHEARQREQFLEAKEIYFRLLSKFELPPTVELTAAEMERLESACRNLPASSVQQDEAEIARDPILLTMSTVLSLTRKWYVHVIPARRYFQQNTYEKIQPPTLKTFRDFCIQASHNRTQWKALAQALWGRNEWTKAKELLELVDYFIKWMDTNAHGTPDRDALQQWSGVVSKEEFVGKIKGLGPRAYEQLLWYINGEVSIKIDRHVVAFVTNALGRIISENQIEVALKQIAKTLGLSPTALDSRIWDFMQLNAASRREGSPE